MSKPRKSGKPKASTPADQQPTLPDESFATLIAPSSDPPAQKPAVKGTAAQAHSADAADESCIGPTPDFANAQEFAKAIAHKCNLVEVGSQLLQTGEVKGASVRARMFETTVEYLYGKPVSAARPPDGEPPLRVVWDIPTSASASAAENYSEE